MTTNQPCLIVSQNRQVAPTVAAAHKHRSGGLIAAAAIWSTALYLLLNGFLAFGSSHKAADEKGATAQACASAIQQFNQAPQPQQVVLMGSSVVMAPVWSTDAKRFTGVADVYHHHRSLELSKLLSDRGNKEQSVFAFALPGLMISDGYLLSHRLLVGARQPNLLVYGLAPRDFMDDLLTGETRTVAFQQLMRLEDIPQLGSLYLSSWQEKLDFTLNSIIYLYGKRWRYQDKALALVRKILAPLNPVKVTEGSSSSAGEQQFLLVEDRKQVWQKSIGEYRARYKHFDSAQFSKQERFLETLLAEARSRGLAVALVNMPLTPDNLSLMPPGLYQTYNQTIHRLAGKYGCSLLDLQSAGSFRDADFYDTVHLNENGGEKCLAQLADLISSKWHKSAKQ
jgi:hypothetical protein